MMEDLEARYDNKMLTLEASFNERLALEKEQIGTLVASDVSQTRELGQVMMCVYRYHWTSVASTITYEGYIDPNYNNGGRADMNLHTGVFTCLTPGFYTITYTDVSDLKPAQETWINMHLNGERVDGSNLEHDTGSGTIGNFFRLTGSRTLVSKHMTRATF